MPAAPAIQERYALAQSIAREAGQLTLSRFQTEIAVERKADQSPVTVADREAELLLRERISASFPDDAILGEEFPERSGTSGFRWIVDPIDGTKSFIHGVPLYGTLIGIEHESDSVVGVIEIPGLDESVSAAVGMGAVYRRRSQKPVPARVASEKTLAEGLLVTTETATYADRGAEEAYRRLEAAAQLARTWGDCYGYLLVVTGRALAMVDPIMNIWDAAAVKPILEEAGGTFTDWQGRATMNSGEGIGTNGHVLREILKITRDFPL